LQDNIARQVRRERISESDKILVLGGMTSREIRMLRQRKVQYLLRLLKNPELINRDTAVNIETSTSTNAGTIFVTTGIKPER
jgi:hypothetical protein